MLRIARTVPVLNEPDTATAQKSLLEGLTADPYFSSKAPKLPIQIVSAFCD
jgi:hypothetical protein